MYILPSILFDVYMTVFGACVYWTRSQPYFLLYTVLLGLKLEMGKYSI